MVEIMVSQKEKKMKITFLLSDIECLLEDIKKDILRNSKTAFLVEEILEKVKKIQELGGYKFFEF